jgi:disulfide bond formation protein DsbB
MWSTMGAAASRQTCFCHQDRQIARQHTGCGEDEMAKNWVGWARNEPAVAAAAAIFVVSAATLLGAWFFEYGLQLQPCPLCLEQRLPYHMVIPLSGLMAIAAVVRAPPKLLATGFFVIFVAMLGGAVLATYHAGIEWHWWPGPADCSGPLTDLQAKGPLLGQLQSINVVRCDEAAWRLFGISLAGYNVLVSLVVAAIAWCGVRARKAAF